MGLSSLSASKAKSFLRRHGRRIMHSKKLRRYRVLAALLLVVILWRQCGGASLGSWKGSSSGKPPGGERIGVAVSRAGLDKPSSEAARHVLGSSGGENCSAGPLSRTCQGKNFTACVENGTDGTFLMIRNGGETPLKVNVIFSPADNITIDEIQAAKQKKVNITAHVGGISSIVLEGGGGGDCVIDMVFPPPPPPSITSGSDKGGSDVPNTPPALNVPGVAAAGKCSVPSESCLAKNLTACLHHNPNATEETSILVQNYGEIPLTVNITLLPANVTLEMEMVDLPYRQWKTVNLTGKVGANTSIRLSAGDWDCAIDMVSESNPPKQLYFYACSALFVSGTVILAAALAYWKLRGVAAARRAGEISYEQLEMGVANASSGRGGAPETAGEVWDQSWGDEDWDEAKAMKSPRTVQKGNLLVNGVKDD
ncbi:hypothetical protein BT93_F1182 [Corymbia citriodora subsp. variegata]|nr:hypothetical protein BT93_F1182 [Corymbia citriodora subsp. variegata]